MRTLAIILATLAIALSPTAGVAKNANTPPGQANNGDGHEPPGQAEQSTKSEPPGQAKNGDKPDTPGQSQAHDEPPGQTKDKAPDSGSSAAGAANDETIAARQALEKHEALPLARIIAIAEESAGGNVINARLVRVNATLLYQLTFLSESGRSWRAYYYARSGNLVTIR